MISGQIALQWGKRTIYNLTVIYALLSTMLLYGCDGDTTVNSESSSHQSTTIRLTIEVPNGGVDNTKMVATRSFTYGFEGDMVPPKMRLKEGETTEGLCVIRNENPKIPIKLVQVKWKTHDGVLWCDTLNADVEAPHDEKIGNWQACFLLGHGTYDEKTHKIKMGVERLARPISQNEEQLWNMPYLSAWLPLKTSDGLHLRSPHVSFKPQGAFIRMRLTNDTKHDMSVASLRMRPTDDSMQAAPFVWEAMWQTDERGDAPVVSPVLQKSGEDFECPLAQPLTLKPGETSAWYGFWSMPIGKSVGYSGNYFVVPAEEAKIHRSPWWLYHTPLEGKSNAQGPVAGRTYTLSLRLRQLVPTTNANWMQNMEDDRLVCKMSIPGTHDTGAWTGIVWVKTQDKDIKGQLESGIRFFDIRLVLDGDVLKLCHDRFVFDRTFHKDVLRATADFLREHPSETVIMTIKRDYDYDHDGGDKYRKAVSNVLKADPYVTPYIAGAFSPDLTMGDLRGKMLIVSREGWYSTNSGWIESWPNNRQFSTTLQSMNYTRTTLHVEDTYKCEAKDKVSLVRQNLLKASEAYGSAAPDWFITFCSYTGYNGIGAPNTVTKYVDPYVMDILRGDDNMRTTGILLFNFAGWWDNGLTNIAIKFNDTATPPLKQW